MQNQTPSEIALSQTRRFFTVLFTVRAKRHLKTLADHYGWSPDVLANYEQRFIRVADMVPLFGSATALPHPL
jgi:hypothetical protein